MTSGSWNIRAAGDGDVARRRGCYAALYKHVLERAKGTPEVCGLRLYVERDNSIAQTTSEGLGMVDAGSRMYEAPTR